MMVLVDENIPSLTAAALREMGHDVADVRGTAGEGMSDSELWAIAVAQGRLLVTTDKGFAARRDEDHYGILIVRLRQPNLRSIHSSVLRAIAHVDEAAWPGLLVTVRDRTLGTWRSGPETD